MSNGFSINALNTHLGNTNRASERLASGRRINRASEDAAGLQLSAELDATVVSLSQGARNADYGRYALDIAAGALGVASDITQRLSELATQSANGVLNASQRASLNEEYQALSEEFSRISQTTQFNGVKLLSGENVSIQLGGGSSDANTLSILSLDLQGIAQSLQATDIGTIDSAKNSIETVSTVRESVIEALSNSGAQSSRLDAAIAGALNQSLNTQEAAARITDADFADELARKIAGQIGSSGAVALQAQANTSAATAEKLL